jgi:beta-lactam-binding protein with PASTA domain
VSSEPPPRTPADEWPARENTLVPPPGDTVTGRPPGPPPDEPDGRLGKGLLLGILLAVLAAAAVAAVWYLTGDGDGQTGATPAETTVTKTTRAAGGSAAAKVEVPDVVGQSQADATAALQGAGLRANPFGVPSNRPVDEVVAQNPPAGQQAERASAVRINVAKAAPSTSGAASTTGTTTTTTTTTPPQPQTATVPNLVGIQMQSAVQQLAQVGLLASVQYVPGEEPLETVRAQSPVAGTSVKHLSHVTVNVSSGPGDTPKKTVPDVVGQSLDPAVAAVDAAGLRLVYLELPVTVRTQAGKIVEQTPAAGGLAPQNSQVLVYLGAFS